MIINLNSVIFVSQLKTKQLLVKEDRIRVKKNYYNLYSRQQTTRNNSAIYKTLDKNLKSAFKFRLFNRNQRSQRSRLHTGRSASQTERIRAWALPKLRQE